MRAAGTYSVTETVTDSVNAQTSSKTSSVTVSAASCGGTVLCNGVAVTGLVRNEGTLSGAYTFTCRRARPMRPLSISGGTGDADLYVKLGSAPTLTSYTCRPYITGNSEIVHAQRCRHVLHQDQRLYDLLGRQSVGQVHALNTRISHWQPQHAGACGGRFRTEMRKAAQSRPFFVRDVLHGLRCRSDGSRSDIDGLESVRVAILAHAAADPTHGRSSRCTRRLAASASRRPHNRC